MPKLTRYPAGITEVREGRISHQECARLLFCKGQTASITKKKIKNIIIHLKTFRFILVNKKADSRYPILKTTVQFLAIVTQCSGSVYY